MWDRKKLKKNAKELLKKEYWKAVVGSLVLMICSGAGIAVSSGKLSGQEEKERLTASIDTMEMEVLFIVLLAVISVLAVVGVIHLLITVFLFNPLEVGAQKLFINCRDGHAEYGNIVYHLKNSYLNAVKTLFLRGLFTTLWSLLFVIPGIIKSYEYRMIPYLLAEDPRMESREAFARSKEMMRGNKWGAFVLDLSFIGWYFLSGFTCGIVGLFYAAPYHNMTNAELYHRLKELA